MSAPIQSIPNTLAPCGVFCGACPSLNKSCFGCASQNKEQERKTKWVCKIRVCCYEEKGLSFCVECPDFPCTIFDKKLLQTHQQDPRYKYRHEIPELFLQQYNPDFAIFLENQRQRWTCPECGGVIYFYHYKCGTCGKERFI